MKMTLLQFEASVRFISGFGHSVGSLEKDSFEISEMSKKQRQQKSILNSFPVTDDISFCGGERLETENNFGAVEYRERPFKKGYTPFDVKEERPIVTPPEIISTLTTGIW